MRMKTLLIGAWIWCVFVSVLRDAKADDAVFTNNPQLVVAAFNLDLELVKRLLFLKGVSPDSRLGSYDPRLFEDKWSLGYSPIGSENWTALLAVANSHKEPQPANRTENNAASLAAARELRAATDPKLIAERNSLRLEIAKFLIATKCNLDLEDGYGATALSAAIDNRYDDLALLLIASNAKVNTKTGVYIDGSGDIAPIHEATQSPKVLEALIKRGADVNVADTSEATPLHWAVRVKNVESVKLLLAAGADVDARNAEGHPPSYWCRTESSRYFSVDPKDREISNLLQAASKK